MFGCFQDNKCISPALEEAMEELKEVKTEFDFYISREDYIKHKLLDDIEFKEECDAEDEWLLNLVIPILNACKIRDLN